MATAAAAASRVASSTSLTAFQRFASVFREAHPIGRMPRYLKTHDLPGAMYYARRLGRAGSLFVPAVVIFFGWPLAFKGMINASNGVKTPKPKQAVTTPVAHQSHKMSRKSSIDSEAWAQRAPA